MTAVWVLGTVAACVMILDGFTAIGYTDSIQTGIIVLGCSWMVLKSKTSFVTLLDELLPT